MKSRITWLTWNALKNTWPATFSELVERVKIQHGVSDESDALDIIDERWSFQRMKDKPMILAVDDCTGRVHFISTFQ